jgi:alanine racemase
MRQMGIRTTLANDDALALIAKTSSHNSKPLQAHIKTDTGMNRNGCLSKETSALLLKARAVKGLAVEGIYSHLSCADDENLGCARRQLAVFNSILEEIKSRNINVPIRHMANSGAIFRIPEARFDMVRPGRALYGYSVQNCKESLRLRPVMRIEAPIVLTKQIKKGDACGYGCTYQARRATRIGLLPLGYADGYSRRWSNSGLVDFKGQLAPVIGRVSMDLTIVDLTDIPEAKTGSLLTVLSDRRAAPHSMESMARRLDTLPHEIGCSFGNRIQRVLSK